MAADPAGVGSIEMKLTDITELVIEPSSYCNAHCPHCARFTEQGQVHPDLPLAHLTEQGLAGLDAGLLPNLRRVTLEGDKGEPAMNPELLHIVRRFTQCPVVIASNGGVRDPAWWAELATVPGVTVNFSIDGLANSNHLYRIGVNWARLQANTAAFIAAGGRARWRCLVFQHNQHELMEIQQTAQAQGFDAVEFRLPHLDRFQGLASWPVQVRGQRSHDLQPTTLTQAQIQKFNKTFRPRPAGRPPLPVNNSRCVWAQQRKIYISFQGQVLPCCMMHFETLNDYPGRERFREFTGGFDRISLAHHTLEDILANVYGPHLEHSLATDLLPVCKKTCYPEL